MWCNLWCMIYFHDNKKGSKTEDYKNQITSDCGVFCGVKINEVIL